MSTSRGIGSPKGFSFTLAADTNYAPEVFYFGSATAAADGEGLLDYVDTARVFIRNLPASARLELDILAPDSTWETNVDAATVAGLGALLALGGARARLRAKAGGSAGSLTGHANWIRVRNG